MLSDRDLCEAQESGDLLVTPWQDRYLQPASIDLTLDHSFLVPWRPYGNDQPSVDLLEVARTNFRHREVSDAESYFELGPQEFVLGSTIEHVAVSNKLCGFVSGKSSLARQGLIVEAAGLVDPGFNGTLTLEIFNMSPWTVRLRPGMRVAQLSVHRLSSPALVPYGSESLGSRYQFQEGPTAAR